MRLSANKAFSLLVFICAASLYLGNKLLPTVGHLLPGIVYLGIFCAVLVMAFAVGISRVQFNRWLLLLPLFCVSILHVVLYIFDGNYRGAAYYMYGEAQVYMYGLITAVILTRADDRQSRRIFLLLLAVYFITAVTTYAGCLKYEGAARELATLSSTDYRYRLLVRENIGGFNFVYELILLTPMVIYMVRSGRIGRIPGAAMLIMFGLTIIQSEYATAVMLYLCCMVLLVLPNLTTRKLIVLAMVVLLVLFMGGTYLGELFAFMSEQFEGKMLKNRFRELADLFLVDDTASGNLGNRMELYGMSLSSFFNSLMLGAWSRRAAGGHSFVLDTMAIFGVLGIAATIVVYRTIYRICIRPYRGHDVSPYLQLVYLMALCLATINPKTFLFVFIFIMPLFTRVVADGTQKEMVS